MNHAQPEKIGKGWVILFIVAAIWNILCSILALSNLDQHVILFFGPDIVIGGPVAELYAQLFWVVVFIFGLGYAIVAKDPTKNRGIVLLGIVCKIYFFGEWTWYWSQGLAMKLGLIVGLLDLIFAVLFIWFLFRTRKFGIL